MKTLTTILTIVLIVISNMAFSVSQKKSNPAPKPGSTNSQKEMYVSIDGDIYKMDASDKNVSPVKININTKYEESSPALSIDGNTLYFVTDRKGGHGGKDIWASEKLSNGNWTEPYNLGNQINTCNDENYPVIMNDGVTLLFTSNGRNENNANEYYSVTMNDEGLWSVPEKAQ